MADAEKKSVVPAKTPEKKRSVIYEILRPVIHVLFHTILPVEYHGAEQLDIDAPYILMGNHQSLMDVFIAALPIRRYQVQYIGKKELWKNRLLAKILNSMHMIPVDRHNTDMEAMRACMRVTREGGVLGIFPEGTRYKSGVMDDLESGVAMIALRSKVPLIPMYITGKVCPFRKLHVYVGKPVLMDDLRLEGVNTQTCKTLLGRITDTYADLQKTHAER